MLHRIIDNHLLKHTYTYDHVFSESAEQQDVYKFIKPYVLSTLEGFNGTIFAYGVTGSGKTHTVMGPPDYIKTINTNFSSNNRGIIPRALETIFSSVDENYELFMSYFQLYNDELYNLLTNYSDRLSISNSSNNNSLLSSVPLIDRTRSSSISSSTSSQSFTFTQNSKKDVNKKLEKVFIHDNISGISYESESEIEFKINSIADAIRLISYGNTFRATAATNLNTESSRSHAILIIKINHHTSESSFDSGKLAIIDLAGSENMEQSGVEGERQKETQSINKSLFSIGHLLSTLSSDESLVLNIFI